MSRITEAFQRINGKGHKAFIPFITAGDPSIEETEQFIAVLEEAGSTVIELGIPFSDPVADGAVIQRANRRAMEGGVCLDKVFEMVGRVRTKSEVPLVFLMYGNTIYHYGIEAFFKRCGQVGVDGVIVPDVPLEEKDAFDDYGKEYGVDWISLVAPTSKGRTKEICQEARGFLYCVSSLGVTGTRSSLETNFGEMFETIKTYAKVPTAIGFGVSNKEQAQMIQHYADGVIVGSAIVQIIETYGKASGPYLARFVQEIQSVL